MHRYGVVAGAVMIAALSFLLGRLTCPRLRFSEFPELGALDVTSKPCVPAPAAAPAPASLIEESLRYSPGDSAGVQVLVWRRAASRATLLLLGGDLPDDEVDAEGREYELEWTKGSWTITGCRAVVRYQPGRP